MTGSLAEIYQGIIALLESDTQLAGLLAPAPAIFQDWPHMAPAFPCLIMRLSGSRPERKLSGVGLWRPSLQIDVLGVDPVIQRDIESRLNTLLDIPRTNVDGIVTTNFTIDLCYWIDSQETGEVRWQNTDQGIKSLATLWALRVKNHN